MEQATRNYPTIEITLSEGQDKGKRFLEIYMLGEKTPKLCFAPTGKAHVSLRRSS